MGKRYFIAGLCLLFCAGVMVILLIEPVLAQNAVMNGTVETVDRGFIGVRGDDGRLIYFQVGWRTKYIPDRYPYLGERVQVTYSVDGPYYIGYVFAMLPPSPPPPTTPPPPPSPYIGPTDPYRGN